MIKNRKKYFGLIITLLILALSIPVYGKESGLQKQGNLIGFYDEIKNMKEDYTFLENEIISLKEECD